MPTDDSSPSSVCLSFAAGVPQTSMSRIVPVPQEPVGEEPLSADVQAFCHLAARIIIRCLKERDERVMNILFLKR